MVKLRKDEFIYDNKIKRKLFCEEHYFSIKLIEWGYDKEGSNEEKILQSLKSRITEYNKLNKKQNLLLGGKYAEENIYMFNVVCFKDKKEAIKFAAYNGFDFVR